MSKDKFILIVGGDKRQKHLENILYEKGYFARGLNADEDEVLRQSCKASIIILPVPVTGDGKNIYSDNPEFKLKISDFAEKIKSEQLVLGGMIKGEIKDIFEKNNIVYKDVCSFEHFTGYNAYLTAQGAVSLLLKNTESLITRKKVLITGFGRIGKALSGLLKGMNMEVFVAARNNRQITEAGCLGHNVINLKNMSSVIYLFDYIFNTVPENIFSETDVYHIRDDSVYFELASKPFGARQEHFIKENKRYVFGGGLPGKYVSYSAAEAIGEFVESML